MKKLLALILALTMVFALAACGSEPAANSDAPSGETEFTLTQTIAGFLGRHMES